MLSIYKSEVILSCFEETVMHGFVFQANVCIHIKIISLKVSNYDL